VNDMSLEIERRFLIKGKSWQKLIINKTHICQGYITSSIHGWTVRVRITDKKTATLTLKANAQGIARYEYEYPIPLNEAKQIFKTLSKKITKTRYYLELKNGDWVVDCFEEANKNLIIAEVELNSIEEKIELPDWCLKEVTSENSFSNAGLANEPFSEWGEVKARKLLGT